MCKGAGISSIDDAASELPDEGISVSVFRPQPTQASIAFDVEMVRGKPIAYVASRGACLATSQLSYGRDATWGDG